MDTSKFMHATLALPITDSEIILGIKKKKLGAGKYNGYGGKVEAGETIEQATVRELQEEAGVTATEYEKVAEIAYEFTTQPEWNQIVHTFLIRKWTGNFTETGEMTIERFPKNALPLNNMWHNDQYWMPKVLSGKKIKAKVLHDGVTTLNMEMEEVDQF